MLAYLYLGEKIGRSDVFAILICFAAVIMISQGKEDKKKSEGLMYNLGLLAICTTAFTFSATAIMTR